MADSKKQGGINYAIPDGAEFGAGEYSGAIKASEWTELTEVKGVRFRTWQYEEVDSAMVDGALVEIQPGCRTPVQYVESDHVFDENIQAGKFLLIYLNSEGLSVYKYDSSVEEVSFTLRVGKGEIMCLYMLKENDEPGEVIECEQPGFRSAKLLTVETGTEKVGELNIPSEFWELIRLLDEGQESDLPVDILDLQDMI